MLSTTQVPRMKLVFLKFVYLAFYVILLFCVYRTACFFVERMTYWRVLAGMMDWPIFIDYARQYIETGHLYENNMALYGPGAPVYKFPPLFVSIIIFCFQHGISEDSLKFWVSMLHIALYFFTAAILLFGIMRKNAFLAYPFAALFLLSLEAFFDNFVRLQLEIYIVFLVSLGIFLLIKKQYFLSGFCLGFSAGLKIYPAFFCVGFIMKRDYRVLTGILTGFLATITISLISVGFDEHWHYFFRITPFMLSEQTYATVENISISYFAMLMGLSQSQAGLLSKVCLLVAVLVIIIGVVYVEFFKSKLKTNNDYIESLTIASGFSVLVSGFVTGSQNSWWNYQLLLMIPVLVGLVISLDRRYFSWISIFTIVVASVFIYAGCVEHLAEMDALSRTWLGHPNFLQPLLVHSVYLRATAGMLIFMTSIYMHYRMLHHLTSPSEPGA